MTKEVHIARHKEAHKVLDALLADFLDNIANIVSIAFSYLAIHVGHISKEISMVIGIYQEIMRVIATVPIALKKM